MGYTSVYCYNIVGWLMLPSWRRKGMETPSSLAKSIEDQFKKKMSISCITVGIEDSEKWRYLILGRMIKVKSGSSIQLITIK